MRFFLVSLLSTLLVLPSSHAQWMCSEVFSETSSFDLLITKDIVTETEILKAARQDLLLNASIPNRVKSSLQSILKGTYLKEDHLNEISLEVRRRNYRAALEKLNIKTKVDIRTVLREHKHYLGWIFSAVANGTANYVSMRFLGTPTLVSIPKTRFFRPDKVPDEVLHEIIEADMGPRTQAYINSRVRHGADVVINNVSTIMNVAIVSTILILHHQMITDPVGYFEEQMANSVDSINRAAYLLNLETIKQIQEKQAQFKKAGQWDKVKQAEALIENIRQQNRDFLENSRKDKP